jgi:hypothetical protein
MIKAEINTGEKPTGEDRATVTRSLSSLEEVLEVVEQAFAALDTVDTWHLVEKHWTDEELAHRAIYRTVSHMHGEMENLISEIEEAIHPEPDPSPGQRRKPVNLLLRRKPR